MYLVTSVPPEPPDLGVDQRLGVLADCADALQDVVGKVRVVLGRDRECRRGVKRHGEARLFHAQISGRGERIRTFDLLNPIQVRYQTALRPDAKSLPATGSRARWADPAKRGRWSEEKSGWKGDRDLFRRQRPSLMGSRPDGAK